ncbi:helix-turn-helix transcriptional regulator [Austwickia chelonae]|uniref:helix-turn-helix transcriptional regulator n=1 Tax=Austwickia chelonae TaxID=100225 RepID=UPI000E26B0AA|nr:helix-turn-helix domain-containing protein [Austwickia chelonae]
MKGHATSPDAPLGPRPANPKVDPIARLSGPRAHVLERLGACSRPTSVARLSRLCGQHPNTVREHLDALVQAGLAHRESGPARGRGRPAILYWAEPLDAQRPQVREYSLLATTMAAHVEATEEDPKGWAFAAGVRQGRSSVSAEAQGLAEAERTARAALSRDGHAPVDAPDGTVRLRQCPLLNAARAHQDVVCSLHQGVLTGIYEAHGVPAAQAMRLTPFALPGCCLIEFPPDPSAGPPAPPRPEPVRRSWLPRS